MSCYQYETSNSLFNFVSSLTVTFCVISVSSLVDTQFNIESALRERYIWNIGSSPFSLTRISAESWPLGIPELSFQPVSLLCSLLQLESGDPGEIAVNAESPHFISFLSRILVYQILCALGFLFVLFCQNLEIPIFILNFYGYFWREGLSDIS